MFDGIFGIFYYLQIPSSYKQTIKWRRISTVYVVGGDIIVHSIVLLLQKKI